ncbi:hypothetical protein B0H14DRAFT_3448424 [Mycena olivaceomarginata]|nr:hypothetical protein B0H14DRAFT_3448424 [Mycena olivaceomarginata]
MAANHRYNEPLFSLLVAIHTLVQLRCFQLTRGMSKNGRYGSLNGGLHLSRVPILSSFLLLQLSLTLGIALNNLARRHQLSTPISPGPEGSLHRISPSPCLYPPPPHPFVFLNRAGYTLSNELPTECGHVGVEGARFVQINRCTSPGSPSQRIHEEIYASDAMVEAHTELQTNLRSLAALWWSDSTHLASFGDAALWPLYLYLTLTAECPLPLHCHPHRKLQKRQRLSFLVNPEDRRVLTEIGYIPGDNGIKNLDADAWATTKGIGTCEGAYFAAAHRVFEGGLHQTSLRSPHDDG